MINRWLIKWQLILVQGIVSLCFNPTNFCLQLMKSDQEMIFTLSGPTDTGYMAIGLGTKMSDSDIIVAYFDNENQPQVSYRRTSNHDQPQPINMNLTILDNSMITTDSQVISFKRSPISPFDGAVPIDDKDIPMIWSYSNIKPDSSGQITKHLHRGAVVYHLKSTQTRLTDNGIVLLHGVLMIVAWLVLPFIAILVARFMKTRLVDIWFLIHCILFILTGIISISAIFLIRISQGNQFHLPHAIIGLTVISLYFLLVALGFAIDSLYSPTRLTIPLRDLLHQYSGRSLTLLALTNIIYGITLLGNPLSFWIPLAILIVTMIVTWYLVNRWN